MTGSAVTFSLGKEIRLKAEMSNRQQPELTAELGIASRENKSCARMYAVVSVCISLYAEGGEG